MPIYEYLCGDCGHELEAMQKISDPVLTVCPDCGAEALKKQISKVAFRLKGTGWYETDFKDKKKDGGKADDGDGKSSTDKSADKADKTSDSSKSDSKVTAKTSTSGD